MSRRLLTRTEYLKELNRQLRSHPAYVDGMLLVPSPDGADAETATGLAWALPEGAIPSPDLFAILVAEVHALHDVGDEVGLPIPLPLR